MAEKRVSVRLAAVGGKQVRAELEGVGDAGVKGFGRMSKEAEIALAAAEACRAHRLATADAIIFATARLRGATLLTCDAHFEGLPGVTLVGKASA